MDKTWRAKTKLIPKLFVRILHGDTLKPLSWLEKLVQLPEFVPINRNMVQQRQTEPCLRVDLKLAAYQDSED